LFSGESGAEGVQAFQRVVKIQNEKGRREINPRQLPNPSRALADKNHFGGAGRSTSQAFGPDARAQIGRALKTSAMAGGSMIADGPPFLVGFGLGKDGSQFDFPRLGRSLLLLAGSAH
jgi:hypothetical protein